MKTDDPAYNISFVKEIEKWPYLWNHTLKEYNRRHVSEYAWGEVAKVMHDTAANCRERWRNIRTAFVRSLTKPMNGPTVRKTYYLTTHLRFLLPYMRSCPLGGQLTTSYSDRTQEEGGTQSEEESYQECLGTGPNADSFAAAASPDMELVNPFVNQVFVPEPTEELSTNPKSECKDENPVNRSEVISALMERIDSKNRREHREDHDMMFLRSLLPDMRKMTDRQKRKFKKKILDAADEILEESEREVNDRRTRPVNSTLSASV